MYRYVLPGTRYIRITTVLFSCRQKSEQPQLETPESPRPNGSTIRGLANESQVYLPTQVASAVYIKRGGVKEGRSVTHLVYG